MPGNILFVDNDRDFLDTRAEYLERAGYSVLKSFTLSEAVWLLKNARIHAAVIDVRMENDDDDRDESGLTLVEAPACRSIPTLILTGHPSTDAAVRVLRPNVEGKSLAVDFVKKEDGPNALIDALNRAVAQLRFRINWNLAIDWKATNPFALVPRFEPGLEGERLVNRAEELEDLFRRLFYERDRIRVDHVLWQRNGRVALTVFAFKGAAMSSFVVVCGQHELIAKETQNYRDFAPKAHGELGTVLGDNMSVETTHFAANAYALAKADLENIRSLADVYRAGDKKLFTKAVETLFEETLAAWQPGPPVPAERALEDLYRVRLGLMADWDSPQAFQVRFQALARYLPALGKMISDPDRIATLLRAVRPEQPTLEIRSPGTLAVDSIFVDANGHAWLTDFCDAGDVPQFWNFVALESAIRFDWIEDKNLQSFRDIEDRLLDDYHFGRPDPQGIEPSAQKVVRSIQPLRRFAARPVGKEYLQYHLGIFFHAARRLADFDPAITPTPNEQARLAHALLAMAMIAAKVVQAERDVITTSKGERGLRVDKDGVKRDGKRISIRGQSYALLSYLAEHSDQVCKQRELIENALKDKFDEKDKGQIGRLQTAIRRLREKIEYDPDQPRYLLTDSDGYKLMMQPSDE